MRLEVLPVGPGTDAEAASALSMTGTSGSKITSSGGVKSGSFAIFALASARCPAGDWRPNFGRKRLLERRLREASEFAGVKLLGRLVAQDLHGPEADQQMPV